VIFKQREGRPNITDAITNGQIDLVVNTPKADTESTQDDSYIRKAAIRAHIPYITTMAAAHASAVGIGVKVAGEDSGVNALQDIHEAIR
jgi:carbamoyl-phosphate synthase large subunit